jgi:hypothetical protein
MNSATTNILEVVVIFHQRNFSVERFWILKKEYFSTLEFTVWKLNGKMGKIIILINHQNSKL